MQICKTLNDLNRQISSFKKDNRSVGFVPTMGALHQGHLALCKRAKQENDILVVSIFVNPIQFNNPKDLEKYPRTEDEDIKQLQSVACDLLFMPEQTEIYPEKPIIKISFGNLENLLEGKFRPGHFAGVGLVVSKLFHYIQPTKAYFGQKDLQQFLVIKQLVQDLSFPIALVCCDIERDLDGLALSSRNVRIPVQLRSEAALIYQSLLTASNLILEKDISEAKTVISKFYAPNSSLELEYFEIVNAHTLENISKIEDCDTIAICVAAYLSDIRLIDNIIIKVSEMN